ncbi:hypothetical protein EDD85DRAFT_434371 [Armillaria nabsnona]|nr:hypothetical protein EDD85DRAFT_434371 [Armillaria nabsnona]
MNPSMLGSRTVVVVVVVVTVRFGRSSIFLDTSCTLTLCHAHYRLAQAYSTVGRPNRTLDDAELETGGRDGGRLRRSGTVE